MNIVARKKQRPQGKKRVITVRKRRLKKKEESPKTIKDGWGTVDLAAPDIFLLQVLHTTDIHGSALPVERKVKKGEQEVSVERGGLARVDSLATRLREFPNTLFVDSGDTISGQVTTDIDGGRSMIDIMNRMNYSAVTLGNHEFDFGARTMEERIASSSFPTVIANVKKADGQQLENTTPSTIVDFGEARIGIVGLLTDQMPDLAKDENIDGYTFEEPEVALGRELRHLRKQEVDAVVVLTHQDDDEDEELAAAFPNAGLIIAGGHSHKEYSEIQVVDGNCIFKSGTQGAGLGQVVVAIDTKENRPVASYGGMWAVEDKVQEDRELQQVITKYAEIADETMGVVVGKLDEPMPRQADRDCRLGNLVTDAMREYHQTDVAIQNTDGIRRELPAGEITLGHIHELFPFQGTEALKGELTGEELLETLNHSVTHSDTDGKSPFLQVSGVTFAYDEKGVKDVKVNGEPLDPERKYSVACGTYLSAGKLGYEALKNGNWANAGIPFTQMMQAYLENFDESQLDPAGTRIRNLTGSAEA